MSSLSRFTWPHRRGMQEVRYKCDFRDLKFLQIDLDLAAILQSTVIFAMRDLIQLLNNTIVWIAPSIFLLDVQGSRQWPGVMGSQQSSHPLLSVNLQIHANDDNTHYIHLYALNEDETLVSTLQPCLTMLLDVLCSNNSSILHHLSLSYWHEVRPSMTLPINPKTLQKVLTSVTTLALYYFHLDTDLCHVLGHTHSQQLQLIGVTLLDLHAFCQGLSSENKGPTHLLIRQPRDNNPNDFFQALLSSLKDNQRLTSLELLGAFHSDILSADHLQHTIVPALQSNIHLKELRLHHYRMSDKAWALFWKSLQDHPTLHTVEVTRAFPSSRLFPAEDNLRAHRLRQRTRVVANCLTENNNAVLQSLVLSNEERDERVWQASVVPWLDRNLYLPRFRGLSEKTHAYGQGLLGKALYKIREQPSLVFMCLKTNLNTIAEG